MTFGELITELRDRGFEDVPATRRERWVNQAYQRICERQAWPFLQRVTEDRASALVPLEIEDLHAVLSVVDQTAGTEVEYEDVRQIIMRDPALVAVGPPTSWYLTDEGIVTYPTSADVIRVRYLIAPPSLVESDDEPLIPERFHDLIVDDACARAHKGRGQYDEMAAVRLEFEAGLREMESSVLVPNFDHAEQIGPSPSTDW